MIVPVYLLVLATTSGPWATTEPLAMTRSVSVFVQVLPSYKSLTMSETTLVPRLFVAGVPLRFSPLLVNQAGRFGLSTPRNSSCREACTVSENGWPTTAVALDRVMKKPFV